jgi:hypothetical protein
MQRSILIAARLCGYAAAPESQLTSVIAGLRPGHPRLPFEKCVRREGRGCPALQTSLRGLRKTACYGRA